MNGSAYLDTRSVLIVAVTMAVLLGVVSLIFARVQRGTQALRLWGWSLLIFALGITLVALRGQVPDFVGVVIGDTVLFTAAIPMLRSVRSFHAAPTTDVLGWLIVGLGFVFISFWTLVTPGQTARIVVFSATLALQFFRISGYLFSTLPKHGRLPQTFTAAVIGFFSASSAARAVLTLTAEKIDDYLLPSNLQSVSLLAYIVFFVAATMGVMWMALQAAKDELAESEKRLTEAQRVAHIGNWTLDLLTNALTWSDEIWRIFETDKNTLPATYDAFLNAVHPDDRQRVDAAYTNSLKMRCPYEATYRLLLSNGKVKHVQAHGESIFDRDGKPLRSIGTVQDVSDRVLKNLALAESEERFRTIADHTFGWEYWLGTHRELLYVNAACERISGYSQAEFGADPGLITRIVHAEDRPAYEEHLQNFEAQQEAHIEFRIVTKTGDVRWIAHGCRAVFSADGRPLGRRISNRDITDLKNAKEQAQQLAYFDSLTKLPNRRMLLDRLNHGLSQAKRFGRPLAIMFLDLDRFKEVNDTLGHDVGDSLLLEVARRLSGCVRAGDTVSRPGGDEFVIVLPEIANAQAATVVAEKIMKVIRQPVCIADHRLDVTISVGIAVYEANAADDATELMKKADIAMYGAKQAGRNGYRLFEEAIA
jgi:diguanylate cyclase (GGDEF)-like protein/PAS domain S-box-containing protein